MNDVKAKIYFLDTKEFIRYNNLALFVIDLRYYLRRKDLQIRIYTYDDVFNLYANSEVSSYLSSEVV